jgi:hypothetical protein
LTIVIPKAVLPVPPTLATTCWSLSKNRAGSAPP